MSAHLNTTHAVTVSISKYARLLTEHGFWASCLNGQSCRRSWLWRLCPRISPQLSFTFFSLYPLLPLCTLPASSLSPEWAGKSCGRLAAHTPGRQIRTRPPAGPFHPSPECRRDRRICSYFYSSSPYPFFSLQHEGGWLGFGNGKEVGGGCAKPRTKRHERGRRVGMVRIEGGEKRRMHVVLFKWMGND